MFKKLIPFILLFLIFPVVTMADENTGNVTINDISMINPSGTSPLTIDFIANMTGQADRGQFQISQNGSLVTGCGAPCLQYDDGTSVCECNCIVTDPGTYDVLFTAYREDEEVNNTTLEQQIVVTEPINWTPDFGCMAVGRSVMFFDSTGVYADSYAWSFGDGTTSTKRNPTHTYKRVGAYGVCLTVTFQQQTKMISKSVYTRL